MTQQDVRSNPKGAPQPSTIIRAFATPIARIHHPQAATHNEELADLILTRLAQVENQHTYKAETAADMDQWGEPAVDGLTTWVLHMARKYIEAVAGKSLEDVHFEGSSRSRSMFNGQDAKASTAGVGISVTRAWASIYSKGNQHPAHFHPNTAISAIYYVQAPETCELDLLDPRPNLDYYDPGLQFADEGRVLRLRCHPGELVLFPGWLKHAVPEFDGDTLRISASWNLTYQLP